MSEMVRGLRPDEHEALRQWERRVGLEPETHTPAQRAGYMAPTARRVRAADLMRAAAAQAAGDGRVAATIRRLDRFDAATVRLVTAWAETGRAVPAAMVLRLRDIREGLWS